MVVIFFSSRSDFLYLMFLYTTDPYLSKISRDFGSRIRSFSRVREDSEESGHRCGLKGRLLCTKAGKIKSYIRV
jgi:hypothetical protein